MNDIRKRLLRAGSLVLAVIVAAVAGYHALLNLSILDSLYLTIVTIATVGYGDLSPHINMPAGANPWVVKLFGMGVIVFGMASMAYTLGVATEFIVSGEWQRKRKEREVRKRMGRLSGHYILCGAGDTAFRIAEELKATGRQCLFVDRSEARLAELEKSRPAILRLHGDATEEAVLIEAGLLRCAGVLAVLPDHKDNLIIAMTAAAHRTESLRYRIVARAKDYDKSGAKMLKAGANAVVAPDYIAGRRMVAEMLRPSTTTFMDRMFRDTRGVVRVEEAEVPAGSWAIGKTLAELQIPARMGLQIVAVWRNGEFLLQPGSDERLEAADRCVVVAEVSRVQKLRTYLEEGRT
jgi:voltage-gated potassium channel